MYKVHAAFDNTEQTIHKTSIQQTPNILHTLAFNYQIKIF